MTIELLMQAAALGGVVLLGLLDLQSIERAARPDRHARARAATRERRCPFCHLTFEEEDPGSPRVRCAQCQTPQHADCWEEHGRCSVHGCGWPVSWQDEEAEELAPRPQVPVTQGDTRG